jgi:hypothetical protein
LLANTESRIVAGQFLQHCRHFARQFFDPRPLALLDDRLSWARLAASSGKLRAEINNAYNAKRKGFNLISFRTKPFSAPLFNSGEKRGFV